MRVVLRCWGAVFPKLRSLMERTPVPPRKTEYGSGIPNREPESPVRDSLQLYSRMILELAFVEMKL